MKTREELLRELVVLRGGIKRFTEKNPALRAALHEEIGVEFLGPTFEGGRVQVILSTDEVSLVIHVMRSAQLVGGEEMIWHRMFARLPVTP